MALRFPYQNLKKKLGLIPRLKIQAMATDPHYTKPKLIEKYRASIS